MPLDDRITITTPEGVDVELTLAGLGSRFTAGLLDLTIEVAVLIALLILFGAIGFEGGVAIAIFLVAVFLVLFGYFVLFEVLNRGRTPGKVAVGLRVVRMDGGPVTFVPSAVRNLLRLVDGWDLLTLVLCPVGIAAVVATAHSQRLGDLAAGTVVTRERLPRAPDLAPRSTYQLDLDALAWDTSAVTPQELSTVRQFLGRRFTLAPNARVHLASDLAVRLRPKVTGADPGWPDEAFLEALVALKTGRS